MKKFKSALTGSFYLHSTYALDEYLITIKFKLTLDMNLFVMLSILHIFIFIKLLI